MARIASKLPVTALKTYQIAAPLDSHWRQASCDEVACRAWTEGWQTVVDESTDLGRQQAGYIRRECVRDGNGTTNPQGRRRYRESRNEAALTVFEFPPGQQCFASHEHRVRVDRQELYVVRDGDWRGNPTGRRRQHARPEEWVEDFAGHQDQLAAAQERG